MKHSDEPVILLFVKSAIALYWRKKSSQMFNALLSGVMFLNNAAECVKLSGLLCLFHWETSADCDTKYNYTKYDHKNVFQNSNHQTSELKPKVVNKLFNPRARVELHAENQSGHDADEMIHFTQAGCQGNGCKSLLNVIAKSVSSPVTWLCLWQTKAFFMYIFKDQPEEMENEIYI